MAMKNNRATEGLRELISIQDAAEYLGVAPLTVRRMIGRGDLDAYRVGTSRIIRVNKTQIDADLLHPIPNGYSATPELHGDPVDNPEKAQLESATTAPRKAQPGSYTTPRTHSVEQQSLGTEVGTELARTRTCIICAAPAPSNLVHPYDLPCGCTPTLKQLLEMYA